MIEVNRERLGACFVFLLGAGAAHAQGNPFDALQNQVDGLQQQIPGWIDWLSIIVTLILSWLILPQVSLFIHGYYYFSGRHLLASEEEAAS